MSSQQLIGRTLAGRFRITGFIGDGAMATVYRGVQDAEPQDVAIKIMLPQLVGDRTFVGRFRREAKAASRLHHPNTVQIVHYGVDDGLFYIVMELCAGQDLFEILRLERRLSEARAAGVVIQVCDALSAAHEQGIVHRDLKPENVMLVAHPTDPRREQVKVLDFGIAKIVSADATDPDAPPSSLGSSALTRVGVVVGTPAYMSPEQCRGEAVDARSDLYGCGVLLFQLVTGKLPFDAQSPFDYALKHVREPPPAPSSLLPAIHPGLEATILTALAKWPAERQQSARALAAELTRLLPELAHEPHQGGAVPPPPPRRAPQELGSGPTAPLPGRALDVDDDTTHRGPGPTVPVVPAAAPAEAPATGRGDATGPSATADPAASAAAPWVPTPWPSLPPPSVPSLPPASLAAPGAVTAGAPAPGESGTPKLLWLLLPVVVAIAIGVGLGALAYVLAH